MIDGTKTDTLLASIAVFAELADSSSNIQSIINRFLKAVFSLENTYSLDVDEAVRALKTHFEFEIPSAVVKTCLAKLSRDGELVRADNRFRLTNGAADTKDLSAKLEIKRAVQQGIEQKLVDYVESVRGKELSAEERSAVTERLIGCLFGRPATDDIAIIVNSFILESSSDPLLVDSLNEIREGIVLVTGLRYTSDLTALGRWPETITAYLDTEILFNAAGFNGTLYKILFEEFHALVSEVNRASDRRRPAEIRLKYFTSVKEEVERFFFSAERIIRKEQNLSPESGAMEEILRGCKDVSDVIRKKADFFTLLRNLGISEQPELDWYSRPEFNVEDPELMQKYRGIFPEEVAADALASFTKINFLRSGINNTSFERCGHVLLSGKNVVFQLARDFEVKFASHDTLFATDLYFFTNRLWFRLNKGFGQGNRLPSTLNVVSNAQIAIAAQLNRSVREKFEELKTDYAHGNLSKDSAQDYNHYLREKARYPEEITPATLAESIEFIHDESGFKEFVERSISLREQAEELTKTKTDFRRYRVAEKRRIRYPLLRKARNLSRILSVIFEFVAVGALFLTAAVIAKLVSPTDTLITTISFVIQVAGGLCLGYKFVRPRARRLFYQIGAKRYFESIKSSE